MVETQKMNKSHHGHNIRIGRGWRRITQEQLAERMGKSQSEISLLETREVIEPSVLQQVAKALDIDINFLETFVPEELLKNYIDNSNPTFNNSVNEGSTETIVVGSSSENQHINNGIPFSEVKEYINELRRLDKEIADMRVLLSKHGIEYSAKGKALQGEVEAPYCLNED